MKFGDKQKQKKVQFIYRKAKQRQDEEKNRVQ